MQIQYSTSYSNIILIDDEDLDEEELMRRAQELSLEPSAAEQKQSKFIKGIGRHIHLEID